MRISDWSADVCSSDLEGYGRRRWRKPRPPSPGISRRSEGADLIIDKGKWEVGMSKRAKLRLQEKLVFAGAAAAVALVGAAPAYAQSSNNQEIGRASCRERVCQYV